MLLNRTQLNGATLNGAALYRVVAAGVSMSCTASVTADAERIQRGAASISALATVVAGATATRYVTAAPTGYADVYAATRIIMPAESGMEATATMLSFVLRDVKAESLMSCSASLSAFVGQAAYAAMAGVAAVKATATKAHPGNVDAAVTATVSASAIANRRVVSSIQAQATARIETTVNKVQETFAVLTCTAATYTEPLIRRFDGVSFEAGAEMSGAPTHNQRAGSMMDAIGVADTSANMMYAAKAIASGLASVDAPATRTAGVKTGMNALATVIASSWLNHAARGDLQSIGSLAPVGTITRFGSAQMAANAAIYADLLVYAVAESAMQSSGTLICYAERVVQRFASTDMVCPTGMSAKALQQHAVNDSMIAAADVLAYPFAYTFSTAASGMLCRAKIKANATARRMQYGYMLADASASLTSGALTFGRTTPDASRTWAISKQGRNWSLPYQNRTFRIGA